MMKPNKTTLAVLIASCFGAGAAVAQETQNSPKILSPVVVTATRVEQDSFDLPMAIDKVEKKDIDGQLRMTLSESLARIPGITAQNRNQMAQDPQISSRGFGARSSFGVRGIRIYVDGIPLSMPDGIGNPGSIDLGAVSAVEVMRGPFSALYGNSSGGVIQLLTDTAPATPVVEADVLYGSFGTKRGSVNAMGTQQGMEYVLNYSDYRSDGFREHSANEKRQATAKLGVKLSDDSKLTTLVNWFDQTSQDPGGLTAANLASNRTMASPNNLPTAGNARVARSNTQIGLNYEKLINSNYTLNIVAYGGQRANLQYLYTGSPNIGRASSINRDFYGTEIRVTHRGEMLDKPYTLTAGLNAGFMYDVRQDSPTTAGNISGSPTRDEIQKARNIDQFVQGSWAVADKWDIHAGVRRTELRQSVLDKLPNSAGNGTGNVAFTKTIPVAGVVYKVNPTLNLYANVGKGFETPTMIEISFKDTNGNGPNLGILPSTSTNIEVGTKWMVSDTTRLNVAAFDINTVNEIVVDQGGTYTTYKNAGKTQRNGLEMSAETRFDNNISLYGAYTLLDAKFDGSSNFNAGKNIPGTYRSQLFGEIAWGYQPAGLSTAVEVRQNSKTFVNDSNSASIDGYTTFSVRASLQQKLNKWTLTEYARIENISDKKYVGSVRVNDTNSRFYEPAPGRNWIVGIKANYAF
jgi:iron complex outermembrane receptor protein